MAPRFSRRQFSLLATATAAVLLVDGLAFLSSPLGQSLKASQRPTLSRVRQLSSASEKGLGGSSSVGTAVAPVALLVAAVLCRSLQSSAPGPRRSGLTVRRFFGGKDKEEAEDDEEEEELSDAVKESIKKLEAEIKEIRETAEEKKGAHERLKKEIDNFRARTRSELATARKKAAVPLVQELLPIADEFDLAKTNLKIETEGQQAIVDKFQTLWDEMLSRWEELGIQKLTSVGEEFNPELHEAVSMIPSEEYKADLVCNELRAGWGLKVKGSDDIQVLRPSLVCVSSGPGPS
eukprot:TRINITY_DN4086_c0_g7_i1.p1 TRINITY_DN4086_c0_g7~~TRINITY_DN4086_c0_g7_i1.p1  ORF type:complete len:292 (-),score=79.62 TRINITY_DN4086_c0_g7_i1:125-1000(-)